MKRIAFVALCAALGISGCRFFSSWGDDGWVEGGYEGGEYANYDVTWTSVTGSLGGHDLVLSDVSGYASTGYGTQMQFETEANGSWALFRLELGRDIYASGLEEGAVLYSSNEPVEMMGCTGDQPYEYDYDGYASEVTVEVLPGGDADSRRLDIVARFDDGFSSQTIRATVIVDLGAAPTDDGYGTTYDSPRSTGELAPLPQGELVWDSLETDLGAAGRFTIAETAGAAYADYGATVVEIETQQGDRWVLFRLTADAQLFSAQTEPGTTFEGGELMGCVGPAPYEFEYDGYADDVQVEILPGDFPEQRVAHLTGSFTTEFGTTQTVEASFTYEVGPL